MHQRGKKRGEDAGAEMGSEGNLAAYQLGASSEGEKNQEGITDRKTDEDGQHVKTYAFYERLLVRWSCRN